MQPSLKAGCDKVDVVEEPLGPIIFHRRIFCCYFELEPPHPSPIKGIATEMVKAK